MHHRPWLAVGTGPLLLAVFSLPASAQAHLTGKGGEAFATGLLHPVSTPAHVLILLALGLSLGQHLPSRLGPALKPFAIVSALALLLTFTGRTPQVPPVLLVCITLIAASAVALAKRLPPVANGVLFTSAALAIGFDSTMQGTTQSILTALLGAWICLNVVVVNVVHCTSLLAEKKLQWLTIGIRVAGSWIFAISLLLLAFSLRPVQPAQVQGSKGTSATFFESR